MNSSLRSPLTSLSQEAAGSDMPYAWVLNLDADFELTSRTYNTPKQLAADLARNGAGAKELLGPDDVIAASDTPKHFLGRAFCPTPPALKKLRAFGLTPEPHPSAEILRRVNHRLFAHELGGGLADQHYVTTRAGLAVLLGRREWLLKRPLSFAGRGQLRVTGALSDKDEAWIAASLRADGLIVEALVRPTLELSVHGFIWCDGRFEIGRVCVQDVSARGVFSSVRLAAGGELSENEESALVRQATITAEALRVAGYFGPFGIDAYRHSTGFCALSEINARYTMAFAVGFPRPSHTLSLIDGP